jgi:hypothetical protein
MTRDDVIRMAREAGDYLVDKRGREDFIFDCYGIERFAALVAAAEREACAKVCDELADDAAKEQDFHAIFACESCASAIRERGQE